MLASLRSAATALKQQARSFPLRGPAGCRSYVRVSPANFGSGFQSNTFVNGILVANGLVFLAWWKSDTDYRLRQFMHRNFTVSGDGVLNKLRLHTLITSCFSHRDGMHLIFNCVCFYSFAQTAMAALNPVQFAALYLGSGLVGSLAFLCPWSKIVPRSFQSLETRYRNRWYGDLFSSNRVGLGASGAVNGLIMWTVCSFPQSLFHIYGIVPVPAIIVGAGIFVYEGYQVYRQDSRDLVGHDAHLGGALFGLAYFSLQRARQFSRRIR